MNLYDEYCEIHRQPDLAPYRWVFRSDESIQVRFGVALSHHPVQGEIALELLDPTQGARQMRVVAEEEGVGREAYRWYRAILPPLANGVGVRYRLGYRDSSGREHTGSRERRLAICDEAPRRLADLAWHWLGCREQVAVYGPPPAITMTPGPDDWDDRVFYSVLLDRFACGDEAGRPRLGQGEHDPSSPFAAHGGCLLGLTERLDYLQALGAGAIIISPVYANDRAGYHGYHPVHLFMVEPRLGTLAQLQELVEAAHQRGMAVVLDVVVNHLANVLDWEEIPGGGSRASFKYLRGDPDAVLPLPEEACNTVLFHGPEYTDMIRQRLFGFLEDWATETDHVRELLVAHLKYWLAMTDVDGFRFDAARHVGLDFWQPALSELAHYAAQLGKRDFLLLAEHAGYSHQELLDYQPGGFSAFIDYPTHYQLKHSLDDTSWLGVFAEYFCGHLAVGKRYGNAWYHNLVFLDNQDTSRLLHDFLNRHHDRRIAVACLHFALACLLLGPQRPLLYAGTEQEFCGALGTHQDVETGRWIGHDCYVREDLFANPECCWKFGPINQPVYPPYCQDQPTFRLIRDLAALRRTSLAFTRGARSMLMTRDRGLRMVLVNDEHGSTPFLVLMNLGTSHLLDNQLQPPLLFGDIAHLESTVMTEGARVQWDERHLQVQLPPFSFVAVRLTLREPQSLPQAVKLDLVR